MNKDKIEDLLSHVDMELLSDLKQNLAEETSKPTDERDEDLISELEEMISETEEEIVSASEQRSLDSIMKMLDEYEEPKRPKLYKWISVAAACLLVGVGVNMASLKVCGQNIFSAVYHITKDGIKVSSSQSEINDDIVVSESDPYGMKAKCAEYGFFPKTPDYIPEGFILDDISKDSNDYFDTIIFAYKKENVTLNFLYVNYKTNDEIPPVTIPTDKYNITEEQINDHATYILKEDNQFTASFIDKRIKYTIFAENLDYDECHKILESLS